MGLSRGCQGKKNDCNGAEVNIAYATLINKEVRKSNPDTIQVKKTTQQPFCNERARACLVEIHRDSHDADLRAIVSEFFGIVGQGWKSHALVFVVHRPWALELNYVNLL